VFFGQLDTDRNGLLTGAEYERAGGSRADANADGRITLIELARMASPSERTVTEQPPSPFDAPRVGLDGDLSRLLDGLDPRDFDRDRDDRLDRKELRAAFFAALDLNEDKRLSFAELSRHPGPLRQLRYSDVGALEQFGRVDWNGGGSLGLREFKLRDEDWAALDVDQSDFVQLEIPITPSDRLLGFVPPRSEWPTRRSVTSGLPPDITVERVFETFDRNGDLTLSIRELRKRPDLFVEFDTNTDDVVTRGEVTRRVDLVGQRGVDASPDTFDQRWDLDGDGRVRGDELPAGAERVRER